MLYRVIQTKLLQEPLFAHCGGGGSLGTPKSDYVICARPLIKVPLQKADLGWLGGLGMSTCQHHHHHNRHHHYPKYKILIKVPSQKAGLGWLGGLDGKGRGEADSAQDGRYMDLLIFCQLLDGSWSLIPWSS